MGHLKKITYLIGPIEHTEDYGQGWRAELKPKLALLGIRCIDPTTDFWKKSIKDERQMLEMAREKRDWDFVLGLMDDIWAFNERSIEECDFITAHFPGKLSSDGTIREMQKAFDFLKPVYLVYAGEVTEISLHILHLVLKRGRIFPDFGSLAAYLLTAD